LEKIIQQLNANMGGEIVLIRKFIVHHESSKGMGEFEDESLTTHCQNAEIVFNNPNVGIIE